MVINIDYIPNECLAILVNDSTDSVMWSYFRDFIGDYISVDAFSYSAHCITMSWRYFLSIKAYIGSFAKANKNSVSINISKCARQMLLNATEVSYENAIKIGKLKEDVVKDRLHTAGFNRDLTRNQIENLEKIGDMPAAATFSVPGAGKTTEALAYFFINAQETDRLLVVAPKNAFGAWDEQLLECVPSINDGFVRLRGGEIVIEKLLLEKPRFMLITYDQLPRVKSIISRLLSENNVFMFLDESHRIKGGRAIKRADAILDMAFLPIRKLIMSGTPMPQSTKDLISQFTFLYPTKKVNEENVVNTIQPIYVRTNQSQLGIPPIQYRVTTLEMSELQRKIYDSLKSEIKRQLNPFLTDTSRYELRKIGKCVMKVMEFVSNPSLLSSDMNYVFDHRIGDLLKESDGKKIEYVCKRVRELTSQGKKVLVWSCFVKNVDLLALRLRDMGAVYIHGKVDAGDELEEDTREWKIKKFHDDPNCKVLIANPAACSEGISLHKICQYAIYLDRSFNAAHFLQSEDRIHRLGMPSGTVPTVEIVECKDSIDQVVSTRLMNKINLMANALNDSSLIMDPGGFEYNDEEEDDIGDINIDDAKAIIAYFFG